MPQIPVSDLEPGMIVASAVEDTQGRILLKPGEEIQARFIPVLRKRGIRLVNVRGDDDFHRDNESDVIIRLTSDEIERIDDRLDRLFAPYEGERDYEVLRKIAQKYVLDMEAWRS